MDQHKAGIAITLLASLLSMPSYATNNLLTKLKQGQAIVQLGAYSASQGKNQNVYIQDLIGDHYSATSGIKQNGLIGLGYFLPGKEYTHVNLFYGINAFSLFSNNVSGNITQENLFTNLAYSYKIANLPIYADAKALIKNSNRYNITLDFGIGPNIIQTSRFRQTSLDGGITLPEQAFAGTTTTAFSATAGIGLRMNNVFGKMPLECGYRIFYLGQGKLNSENSAILNNLKTGHNYAQAVVCGIII